MRRSATLLLGAALAVSATSCLGRGQGAAGGDLRATQVIGAVVLQPPGEPSRPLREGDRVTSGSSLRTGSSARARLESADDRAVELAGDTQATVVSGTGVALGIGSALAEAGSGSLSFDSLGITVRVAGGVARLERLLGTLRVGVYSGGAHVDLLGRGVDIPAYRELFFSGGIPLDRAPRPLQLKQTDPWDRRLLGDVLELDRELSQFGRGFNSQFGAPAVTPRFFVPFVSLPGVEVVVAGAPSGTTPADALIGLVFAQQLVRRGGTGASAQTLFGEMMAENRARATWGLIAKERGLALPPLFQAVLDAIRRGTAPPSAPGISSGGGGGSSRPTPPPTSSPSPRPRPKPKPTPTKPPPPPTPPCSRLLDRLLGNCPAPQAAGSAGSPPGSSCSIVGVLIDPKC